MMYRQKSHGIFFLAIKFIQFSFTHQVIDFIAFIFPFFWKSRIYQFSFKMCRIRQNTKFIIQSIDPNLTRLNAKHT